MCQSTTCNLKAFYSIPLSNVNMFWSSFECFSCIPFSSVSFKDCFRKKKTSVCIGGRELLERINFRVWKDGPTLLRMSSSRAGPESHSQHPCWAAHKHLQPQLRGMRSLPSEVEEVVRSPSSLRLPFLSSPPTTLRTAFLPTLIFHPRQLV